MMLEKFMVIRNTISLLVISVIFSCSVGAATKFTGQSNFLIMTRDDGLVYVILNSPTDLGTLNCTDTKSFNFDASTPAGKNMLGNFIAAKLSGRGVEIGFTDEGKLLTQVCRVFLVTM